MTTYFEEFISILKSGFEEREARKPRLFSLISELEESGNLLGAGLAASRTMTLFLGEGDWESKRELGELALELLERESQKTDDALSLALTHLKRSHVYNGFLWPGAAQNLAMQERSVYHRRAAAEILVDRFSDSPDRNSYLISGFELVTDFSERWELSFVDYEVEENMLLFSKDFGRISVPGAFQLFISVRDYTRALEVAELAPSGFKYPGICGWREVCYGILDREQASQHFLKAAEHFASDTCPEEHSSKLYWSSFHSQILAPYFRARAVLSRPCSSSDEVIEALRKAAEEIHPNMAGQSYPPNNRLAILVHGLGSFLETNDESALDQLAQSYQKEMELWSQYTTEDEEILLEGLSLVAEAIEGFRYDPVGEITKARLPRGIRILETIPDRSQLKFVSRLERKLGESALEVGQEMTYCEVVSALRTITDERVLQRLVLQLLRAEEPYHAKITHGPIEFGKDVLAVVDDEGAPSLNLYAVKVGDIDAGKWPSVKESIDQIFTVENSNPLVTQASPTTTRAFLVFNGHFNAYTDPIADGWFRELRLNRGWNIEILDLDGLSRWIISHRLVRVFKEFIARELE
jgi:hypothetical protein